MRRRVRIIGFVVSSIFLLLLIVSLFIPVNHFRPTMEKEASEALGRKVQIGKLSLSLVVGQISAENLVIADDPRFSQATYGSEIRAWVLGLPRIWPFRTTDYATALLRLPGISNDLEVVRLL